MNRIEMTQTRQHPSNHQPFGNPIEMTNSHIPSINICSCSHYSHSRKSQSHFNYSLVQSFSPSQDKTTCSGLDGVDISSWITIIIEGDVYYQSPNQQRLQLPRVHLVKNKPSAGQWSSPQPGKLVHFRFKSRHTFDHTQLQEVADGIYRLDQAQEDDLIYRFMLDNIGTNEINFPQSDRSIPFIQVPNHTKAHKLLSLISTDPNLDQLEAKMNLSKRTVQRLCGNSFNLNISQIKNIYRFKRVLHTYRKNQNISMAELAANAGYYDESHMIKDFTNLNYPSPKKFFQMNHLIRGFMQCEVKYFD
ncbi:helix-turn-helix domain-containing protein [Marinicella meishanensis]|uniref:helix-turn-helix domain-containing protein n=1 Tax=Marinicella meishanensis TaxID=2873263 RepID=UPI001CBFF015|nr:helix-turn-helix domain-containing protein [Marinicella sp. NBU2979]